ncbi:hypothetical protein [Sphingomonas sp. LM7]|uniref:hypothetical protein n=1 Tax=Sphingomonas sp. LM7 TaxID=1938607 RepID=UPI000983FA9F|nr:hypothetical protein [Sphingomonas sp. LM7]AQR73995.1 hypothetical protein BXU08_10355 [Sphingomonas sp. LM7]
MILLLALTLAAQDTPAEGAGEEIVVVGERQTCRTFLRGKALSDRELDRHAKDWRAGIPVRIRAPSQSDYPCLAKIAFKLNDKGVRLIEFVDP